MRPLCSCSSAFFVTVLILTSECVFVCILTHVLSCQAHVSFLDVKLLTLPSLHLSLLIAHESFALLCLAYISFSHTVATVLPSAIYLATLPYSKNSPEGGLASCLWPTSDTQRPFVIVILELSEQHVNPSVQWDVRPSPLLCLLCVSCTCHTHFHYTAKIKALNLLYEGCTKSLLCSIHTVTTIARFSQTGGISSEQLPNPFVSHGLVTDGKKLLT